MREAGAVVHRGPHDGQAQGDVDGPAEGHQLDRHEALIVVAGDHRVELAFGGAAEHRVGRNGVADVDMPRRRRQLGVVAPDRVDREGLAAERGGDFVGVQARGVDHVAGEDRFARGPDRQAVGTRDAAVDAGAGAGQQRHLARRGHPRQGAHVGFGLQDSRRRRPGGRRRLDVRLAPAHESALDHLEVGDAVGVSPRRERFERPDLVRGGDDQLAATLARHSVLLAEGVQPLASLDAEDGLQGIPRVIDAGVDDAAVVGAGLLPGAGQAFDHARRAAAGRHRARRGQSDQPAAHGGDIDRRVSHRGCGRKRTRQGMITTVTCMRRAILAARRGRL